MKEYWIFAFKKHKIDDLHFTNRDQANAEWFNLHKAGIPTFTETIDDRGIVNEKFHDIPRLSWKKAKYDTLFDFMDNDMRSTWGEEYLGSTLCYCPELNVFEFKTKRTRPDLGIGIYEEITTYVNAYDRDSFFARTKLV